MQTTIRKVDDIEARFSYLLRRDEKVLQESLGRWFAFSNKQIQNDLRTKFQKFSVSDVTDWEFLEEQGKTIIKPAAMNIVQSGGNEAYKTLKVGAQFDILNEEAVKAANKFTADLVRDVNKGTKQGIRTAVSAGIKEGKSMDRIAREIKPLVGLTANQAASVKGFRNIISNKEKYPNLSSEQVDKKVQRYADKTHRRRIQSIARTETARAQNIGYAMGMENIGIMELEFSISPAEACPICESLDETRYPVKEARGIIPVHPNCRCAMLPVIAGKTAHSLRHASELIPEHVTDLVSRWEGAVSRSNKWVVMDKLRKLGYDTSGKPLGTLPPITPPPVIVPKPLPLGKLPQEVQNLVGKWQAASSRSNKWVIQNKLKKLGYNVRTRVYKPTGIVLPKPRLKGPEAVRAKMDDAIDDMIKAKPAELGPLECHDSVAKLEAQFKQREGVQYFFWDESKGDDFYKLLNKTPFKSKDAEVMDLINGLKQGTVNGHSFVRSGKHYVDPHLKSLGVAQKYIDEVDDFIVSLQTKLARKTLPASDKFPPKPKLPKPAVKPVIPEILLPEAKTKTEAEKAARKIFGRTTKNSTFDYSRVDIKLANETNQALYNFKRTFPDSTLHGTKITTRPNEFFAMEGDVSSKGRATYTLNLRVASLDIYEDILQDAYNAKQFVSPTIKSRIYHEMGHQLTYKKIYAKAPLSEAKQEALSDKITKLYFKSDNSNYASLNGFEGLAEAVAQLVEKGHLKGFYVKEAGRWVGSKKVKKLVEKYVGKVAKGVTY